MGQRHQAFLIARIRPSQGPPAYRCVGAFHHQWCYGTLPLSALHRFVDLLRRQENGAVVRGELGDLDGKYEAEARIPATPCPYTVSLLGVAWTMDLAGTPYVSGVTLQQALLDANMGCWGGHNDDGITIIDITDPNQPAYCFMHPSQDTPLSAYEYLRHYYDLPNLCRDPGAAAADASKSGSDSEGDSDSDRGSDDNDPADLSWPQTLFFSILKLAGLPIIPANVLQEAWPSTRFLPRDAVLDVIPGPCMGQSCIRAWLEVGVRLLLAHEGLPRESLDPATLEEAAVTLKSACEASWPSAEDRDRARSRLSCLLRDPALYDFVIEVAPPPLSPTASTSCRDLVDEYLASPLEFDEPRRDSLVRMPGVVDNLRAISPLPAAGVELLIAVLTETTSGSALDLSGLALSAEQVMEVVSTVPDISSLDLSRNPHIVADDVPDILAVAPTILRLIVMECPSLDGGRLLELIRDHPGLFRHVEGILHPSLLTLIKQPGFPIAFTVIIAGHSFVSGVALPFFTPNLVLQALATVLPLAWRERYPPGSGSFADMFDHFREYGTLAFSSALIIYAALTTGSLASGERWGERPVVSVPLQPLAVVSDHADGSWAFFLDWHPPNGRACWGFIHYSGAMNEDDGRRKGTVYDLEEFLRCMANEGRPAPDPDLVHKVKGVLNGRHDSDGTRISPLIDEGDVPEVTTRIPAVDSAEDESRMLWEMRHLYRIPGFDSQY